MYKKRRIIVVLVMTFCLVSVMTAYAASSSKTQKVILEDTKTADAYFQVTAGNINLFGFATCSGKFFFTDEYDSSGNLRSTFDNCANRDGIAVTFPVCTLSNLRTGKTIKTYSFSLYKRFCDISGSTYTPLGARLDVEVRNENKESYWISVYTG